jgi:hypothetical protein
MAERHQCQLPLACKIINLLDQGVAPAGAWNISSGGVCVITEPHYPRGSHVEVAMHKPSEAPTVRRFAKVVHTIELPSLREMWLTGCSFCGDAVPDEELQPLQL